MDLCFFELSRRSYGVEVMIKSKFIDEKLRALAQDNVTRVYFPDNTKARVLGAGQFSTHTYSQHAIAWHGALMHDQLPMDANANNIYNGIKQCGFNLGFLFIAGLSDGVRFRLKEPWSITAIKEFKNVAKDRIRAFVDQLGYRAVGDFTIKWKLISDE